ncbi:hypothetical protein CLF_106122 [Clonorchis sinensis]|uniref:C2H2-type domain-containing protein n=1 Tax=Clonorchis sinensis TaxID=79923 RepID=G7YPN5_CLOSI|nr:hypothetical protein CLF_106122 [Clonorchis sinensis]
MVLVVKTSTNTHSVLVTFDNVHNKPSGATAPVPTNTQERLVEFTCEECGKCYKSKAGSVAHHQVHNNESVGTNMVVQLACADCSRLFQREIGLNEHRRHAHPVQHKSDKLGRVNEMMDEQYQVKTFVMDELAVQVRVARVVFGCNVMLCYFHIRKAVRKHKVSLCAKWLTQEYEIRASYHCDRREILEGDGYVLNVVCRIITPSRKRTDVLAKRSAKRACYDVNLDRSRESQYSVPVNKPSVAKGGK